jgi:hypothetical protein
MISMLIVDAIGLLLFVRVLHLVRKGSLYVGYGSALLIGIGGIVCVASAPTHFVEPLLQRAGTILPGGLLVFLALYCFLLTLIYVLNELTALSRRLRTLTQQLAIELARSATAYDSGEPVLKAQHSRSTQSAS